MSFRLSEYVGETAKNLGHHEIRTKIIVLVLKLNKKQTVLYRFISKYADFLKLCLLNGPLFESPCNR